MLLSNKRSYQEQENPKAQSSKIKEMKSHLARAQSLVNKQLTEKEKEYNDLVAMMDDKFTALVDEKQKLNEKLEQNEEQLTKLDTRKEERIQEMEQATKSYKEQTQEGTLNTHILSLKQTLHQQADYESMSKLQKELKTELEKLLHLCGYF